MKHVYGLRTYCLFFRIILCLMIGMASTVVFAGSEGKPKSKAITDQKITLNLLEAIAPQKHEGEGNIVTSSLGKILNDPKNETLKAVKVLGRKKRIQGDCQKVTQIIWEEVALDVVPSTEMASRGIQVPTQNSLKEPVKKPLQSAFRQRSEVIESGTPIEAKGDVEGLLAAARSLLIRAAKQGYKVVPVSVKGSSRSGHQVASQSASSKSSVGGQEQRVRQGGRDGNPLGQSPEELKGKEVSDSKMGEASIILKKDPTVPLGNGGASQKTSKQTSDSPLSPTTSRGSPHQSASYGSYPSSSNGSFPQGSFPQGSSPYSSSSGSAHRGNGLDYASSPWSGQRGGKKKDDSPPSPVVINLGDSGNSPVSSTPTDDKNLKTPKKKGGGSEDDETGEVDSAEGEFDYLLGKRGEDDDLAGMTPPVIRIDYDFDVCAPRIDWGTKQVILQAKALTFKDGVKIVEGDCADTPKRFAIQKDYTCDVCEDVVEKKMPPSHNDLGFAYATYRPYWLDQASQRTYLKDPQRDEKHPFALKEESGKCTYKVDLTAQTAIPQSELIYDNRAKQRVVVEGCRPSIDAQSIPITTTQKSCGIVHDFAEDRSIQQQRLIYSLDGVEHEVVPCHDVGGWMAHEFDKNICKPFVDHSVKKQQPMARRFIMTPQGKTYLTECEPYGSKVDLEVDYAVCASEPFHHDFASKQSYRKGRYYYDHPLKGRKYLTPCQPITDSLLTNIFTHKKTLVGYEHNDAKRISKTKIEVSIDVDGTKVVIVPVHIDEKETEAPYAKQGEKCEVTAYQTKMNDQCFQEQRFRKNVVYQRIDGSEVLERTDDKVQTVDLCVRSKETNYEPAFVSYFMYRPDGPHWDTGGKPINTLAGGEGLFTQYSYVPFDGHHLYNYFPCQGWLWKTDREMGRTKITYPDLSSNDPPWVWTGFYKDHSVRGAHSGAAGPQPTAEGERWHHTERKF